MSEDGQGGHICVRTDDPRIRDDLKRKARKDIFNNVRLMASNVNRAELNRVNEQRKELVKRRGVLAKNLKLEEEERKADEGQWALNGGWARFGKTISEIKEVSKNIKQIQDQILEWMDAGALLL